MTDGSLRFLLDNHFPSVVAREIHRRREACEITMMRDWHDGRYLDAPDEDILQAAASEDLTLVTRDVATIPSILESWREANHVHAGVIFVPTRSFPHRVVGRLVRALIQLWDEERDSSWRNRKTFLGPISGMQTGVR